MNLQSVANAFCIRKKVNFKNDVNDKKNPLMIMNTIHHHHHQVVITIPCLNHEVMCLLYLKYLGGICVKDNPCVNDGVCGNTLEGYICKCPTGWEGDNCDIG